MRFDDTIATVLAQPVDRPDRRTAQWRQLVDLLGQDRGGGDEERERAFAHLRQLRAAIDPEVREAAARALAGLAVSPDLLAFFAEDRAEIAAPLIAGAVLTEQEWLGVLPRLGPTARALLRHRRDLPSAVGQALASFGPADFAISGARGEPVAEGESQIRELVERIESYRRQKQEQRTEAAFATEGPIAESFRWECGGDGTIRWIEGAPREALVGESIAVIGGSGAHGVDGQAAGAFEKKSPFRDARFSVAGQGAAAGDWRISGVPCFDPATGSFTGYRGTARRPRLDEIARGTNAGGVMGTPLPADSLRQLIHELKTPLNAIIGFAEMIEGQYLGPAAEGHRGQASSILDHARKLLSAIDDLDTAARIESDRLALAPSAVDAAALFARLHESYQRVAQQRGAVMELEAAPGLPAAAVEPQAAERMFARLLAATIGLAEPGETIGSRIVGERRAGRPVVRLSVDRPQAISGLDETALLDPGYSPDGDWPAAPALGLGFALRLVRNLAEAAGGGLFIGRETIALVLPAAAEPGAAAGNGEAGA